MSLWRSAPGRHRAGWRVWVVSVAVTWLAPVAFGVVLMGLATALGAITDASGVTGSIYIVGLVLLFSPIVSWIGLVIALPVVAWLFARGWAGGGSLAALGFGAGLLAGGMLGEGYLFLGPVFGTLAALGFHWLFIRLS